MTDACIKHMTNAVDDIDWTQLNTMDVDDRTSRLLDIIQQIFLYPIKSLNIQYKNILREP